MSDQERGTSSPPGPFDTLTTALKGNDPEPVRLALLTVFESTLDPDLDDYEFFDRRKELLEHIRESIDVFPRLRELGLHMAWYFLSEPGIHQDERNRIAIQFSSPDQVLFFTLKIHETYLGIKYHEGEQPSDADKRGVLKALASVYPWVLAQIPDQRLSTMFEGVGQMLRVSSSVTPIDPEFFPSASMLRILHASLLDEAGKQKEAKRASCEEKTQEA